MPDVYTLTSSVSISVAALYAREVLELSSAQDKIAYTNKLSFTDGVENGQCTHIFRDIRTLTPTVAENLDLSGVLLDPFNNALAFTRIKTLIIVNRSIVNSIVIGGHASAAWVGPFGATTHTLKVPPGYLKSGTTDTYVYPPFILTHPGAGWTVTATTADLLKVIDGGEDPGSTDYAIIIYGLAS